MGGHLRYIGFDWLVSFVGAGGIWMDENRNTSPVNTNRLELQSWSAVGGPVSGVKSTRELILSPVSDGLE